MEDEGRNLGRTIGKETSRLEMPRKILIDCDPGIDDAVALCLALFDPRLEVVGITATAGNVDAHQATSNVITILDQLDPPKWPRIGAAIVSDRVPAADARHIHGEDGLGDVGLVGAELHNQHPAEKVISEVLHEHPGDVTILALGPLTNVALALQREQDLAERIDRIVMMGGAVRAAGNVRPGIEFNFFCDPEAARCVFQSPTTKILIPLDVSTQVNMTFDLVDALPSEETRAGALMRKIVPKYFQFCRQHLGQEVVHMHDAVALQYCLNPELFQTEEVAGDVETQGLLTRGATVFDQRERREWRNNMDVALGIDHAAIVDCIVRGLKFAGQNT